MYFRSATSTKSMFHFCVFDFPSILLTIIINHTELNRCYKIIRQISTVCFFLILYIFKNEWLIITFHSNDVLVQQNTELRECCYSNRIPRKSREVPKTFEMFFCQSIPQTKNISETYFGSSVVHQFSLQTIGSLCFDVHLQYSLMNQLEWNVNKIAKCCAFSSTSIIEVQLTFMSCYS